MTERQIPPQDIEAEMSLLGAIFVDNEAIDEAHEIIAADDIYREAHRKIFKAMASLADKNEPIDLVTLTDTLKGRRELEEVGGAAYLAVLVDFVPMAANVAHYCRIVSEKAAARRAIVNATDAIQHAYRGEMEEAVVKLECALQPSIDKDKNAPVAMSQTCREMVKRIEYRSERRGQILGLSYGLHELDQTTLGANVGELIIVAGRPSMGKSAFLGNFVRTNCAKGKSGLLFNLEMCRLDVADRLAAAFGVNYGNIRSGNIEEREWPKLAKAMGLLNEWDLEIDDTPAITLREIRAKARRKKKKGLDFIGIDYLQLMAMSDPKMNRVQGVGEISRGLKQLAKELEIPIVALSQLNRGVDSRNDKRPLMSDLRESGEIEQDADVILFPYRPAAYCEKCKDRVDDHDHNLQEHLAKAEVIVAKNRAGEMNVTIPAVWLGHYQRFESATQREDLP